MKSEPKKGMSPASSGGGRKNSLTSENLRSRRDFLKRAARKSFIPAIVIYSVNKMTPPAFGRTPI